MSDLTNHYIGKSSDEDPMDALVRSIKDSVRLIVLYVIAAIIIALLFSCKSQTPVMVARVDTVYVSNHHRDSIYLHDSVFHEIVSRGDTVFVTKDRWRTQYRDRLVHDSVYVSKCDTIVSIVEKEKPLRFIDELRLHIANIAVFFVGIMALLWLLRRKFGV